MKISKKILMTAALLVAATGGLYAAYSYLGHASANQQLGDYVTVKRGDLAETVNATGQVKAASDVSLSFQRSGNIASVPVQVGQAVRLGQALASLDDSDLQIQLNLAQNALDAAQIKLDQLKNAANAGGSGSTEIQTAINNNWESSANKIKEAYIATDGVMGTSVDQFFDEAKSANPVFGLTVTEQNSTTAGIVSSTYEISAPVDTAFGLDQERRAITDSMDKWNRDLNGLNQGNIENVQSDAENSLKQIQSLLTNLASVVNSYNSTSGGDDLVYNSYKSVIQNARVTVDSTLAGILSAKQAYNSSKANANPDDVKMQKIAVLNAQNQIKSIQNQIAKSAIYSPIDGIVSVQNAKIGQTASAGAPLIDIFSDSNLQIEVYLPESDVAKVKTGQAATVTLDAYGAQTFAAHVISVNPESTPTGTVQGYKTTLQFDQNNNDIKPGMTANASIQTSYKNDVIAIPATSIIQKNGESFVMVRTAGQNEEQKITTGITGANGYVEITDGLKEGETIINY